MGEVRLDASLKLRDRACRGETDDADMMQNDDAKSYAYVHVRRDDRGHPVGTVCVSLKPGFVLEHDDGTTDEHYRVGVTAWHRGADAFDKAKGRDIARGRAERSRGDRPIEVIVEREPGARPPRRHELLTAALHAAWEACDNGTVDVPAKFVVALGMTAERMSASRKPTLALAEDAFSAAFAAAVDAAKSF